MPRAKKELPTPEGQRLIDARHAAGLSQQKLADSVGVTRQYIAKMESSKPQNPVIGVVRRLAEALGVNPAWLVCWSDRRSRRV